MIGRILAACGWIARQVENAAARLPLRRLGIRRVVLALAVLLALAGVVPLAAAALQDQPQNATVEEVRGGSIEDPDGWVRLRGRVVPLERSPTGAEGHWALLVDATDRLRAIVLSADAPLEARSSTVVTGHLIPVSVAIAEDLPLEATIAGAPPLVVADQLVVLDAEPLPERSVTWPLVVAPWLVAAILGLGVGSGYPVFRPTREVHVLSTPMTPGERVPAAVAGRLGQQEFPLERPADALVLCRQGPHGGILTAQVLPSNLPPPAPVQIGGGWTSGRVGYVYTVDETLPALAVRSDRADAIIMFARVAERDRAAALVAIER